MFYTMFLLTNSTLNYTLAIISSNETLYITATILLIGGMLSATLVEIRNLLKKLI
jgi:hypothetical protein